MGLPVSMIGVPGENRRRDTIGLVAGVAALLVYVGSAHIGEAPCPESGTLTIPAGGEGSVSCTDFVSIPWLVGGILLLIVALVSYRMARGRRQKPKLKTQTS